MGLACGMDGMMVLELWDTLNEPMGMIKVVITWMAESLVPESLCGWGEESFRDARDLGPATGRADFESMVDISHLFFGSRADPFCGLEWMKIGTSEFPTSR
jgi:hypothetical protein